MQAEALSSSGLELPLEAITAATNQAGGTDVAALSGSKLEKNFRTGPQEAFAQIQHAQSAYSVAC